MGQYKQRILFRLGGKCDTSKNELQLQKVCEQNFGSCEPRKAVPVALIILLLLKKNENLVYARYFTFV